MTSEPNPRPQALKWVLIGAVGMVVVGLVVVGLLSLAGTLTYLSGISSRPAVTNAQTTSSGTPPTTPSRTPQAAPGSSAASPIDAAIAQAESDLADLKHGLTQNVYNGASQSLRDQTPYSTFNKQVSVSPILQGWTSTGTPLIVATKGARRQSDLSVPVVSTVDFVLPLSTPSNTEQLQVEYVLEGGAFKLNGFAAAGGQGTVGKTANLYLP